jgi:aspartyl-tRNA(Asn)/glutamyl-tRNA(Gln) amidotransferase subunit A
VAADSALAICMAVKTGQKSARAFAEAALARFDFVEARVHAFLHVDRMLVLEQADAVDAKRARGEVLGALAGVPIAVKDAFCTHDMPTTAGSKLLAHYRPPYDATAVARLRAQGAVIFGKTNMDEFGMGSSTEFSAFGPTCNPHDVARSPGGSSGGSAAAVAAGVVPLALGSDTGGSVRQPASYTGIIGFKPSYGRIPRTGLIAYASTLDHVGVFARTADDASLAFGALAGEDGEDASALPGLNSQDLDALEGAPQMLRGIRIGVPQEYFRDLASLGVRARIDEACNHLSELGASIVSVSLREANPVAAYTILACAEASSNLSRYDGIRFGERRAPGGPSIRKLMTQTRTEGFGPEVRRRILVGTFVLSEGHYEDYYAKAVRARSEITEEYLATLCDVDVLMGPTTPDTPPLLGQSLSSLERLRADWLTLPANLTGLPAISVPFGLLGGLPFGLQFQGRHCDERLLLRIASHFTSPNENLPW